MPPWHRGLGPRAATMGPKNWHFSDIFEFLSSFPSPKWVQKKGPENEPRNSGELFDSYWFAASAGPKTIPKTTPVREPILIPELQKKYNQGARKRSPRGHLRTHVLRVILLPLPQPTVYATSSSAPPLNPRLPSADLSLVINSQERRRGATVAHHGVVFLEKSARGDKRSSSMIGFSDERSHTHISAVSMCCLDNRSLDRRRAGVHPREECVSTSQARK